MGEIKKVWNEEDNSLYLSYPSKEFGELENSVYSVNLDNFGRFYLTKISDGFTFDYKIYGLETKLVNRILKTYEATKGNLGILLNGLKGTGKTVSSKIIASKLNQPILLIDKKIDGIHNFLNSITQNITIFIDEYEKVFGETTSMLTIMDGALNSNYRRVFLLTTNDLYIDKNLIQRPGRIRYLKKFVDLTPEVVSEIVEDILVYSEFKSECIKFISNLETITVDIVKAVVNEVNIHNEGPSAFEDVFNVKKLNGRYNLSIKDTNGEVSELATGVSIYPNPTYNENSVGRNFEIGDQYIGTISKVLNWTTVEISPFEGNKGQKLGFDEPIIVSVSDANIVNYSFAYDTFGSSLVDIPKIGKSELGKTLLNKIEEDRENSGNEEDNELGIQPAISEDKW